MTMVYAADRDRLGFAEVASGIERGNALRARGHDCRLPANGVRR